MTIITSAPMIMTMGLVVITLIVAELVLALPVPS